MRVSLDRERCVGAGHCVFSAPRVFDQDDDDGVAVLLDASPGPDAADEVYEAADLCPAGAILVSGGGR